MIYRTMYFATEREHLFLFSILLFHIEQLMKEIGPHIIGIKIPLLTCCHGKLLLEDFLMYQ